MKNDLMGAAMEAYYGELDNTPIQVKINGSEEPEMPPSIFFREYKNMLKYERLALKGSVGKVLDLGCGAGCHSLYLQKKGLQVTAVEISKKSVRVAKERGVNNVIVANWRVLDFTGFDTVLVLMNGMGLAHSLEDLKVLFEKLRGFLTPSGCVYIDSTDVTYAKADWPIRDKDYFGKVQFELKYKGKTNRFPWMFVDFETACDIAKSVNLRVDVVEKSKNGHFLLRLSK